VARRDRTVSSVWLFVGALDQVGLEPAAPTVIAAAGEQQNDHNDEKYPQKHGI